MNVDTYHRIASRIPDSSDRWATAIDLAEELTHPGGYGAVVQGSEQERIDFVYECMRDEIRTPVDIEEACLTFLGMAAGSTTWAPETALALVLGEATAWDYEANALVSESGWVIDLYCHDPYMVTPDGSRVLRFTDSPNRFPAWIRAQVAMWKVPA